MIEITAAVKVEEKLNEFIELIKEVEWEVTGTNYLLLNLNYGLGLKAEGEIFNDSKYKNVRVCFYNSYSSIHFDNQKTMNSFVKEYKLKLDLRLLSADLIKSRKKVKVLNSKFKALNR